MADRALITAWNSRNMADGIGFRVLAMSFDISTISETVHRPVVFVVTGAQHSASDTDRIMPFDV
jgi:hypothetical protein